MGGFINRNSDLKPTGYVAEYAAKHPIKPKINGAPAPNGIPRVGQGFMNNRGPINRIAEVPGLQEKLDRFRSNIATGLGNVRPQFTPPQAPTQPQPSMQLPPEIAAQMQAARQAEAQRRAQLGVPSGQPAGPSPDQRAAMLERMRQMFQARQPMQQSPFQGMDVRRGWPMQQPSPLQPGGLQIGQPNALQSVLQRLRGG